MLGVTQFRHEGGVCVTEVRHEPDWLGIDERARLRLPGLHAHLITSAREWDAGGRDREELYRGARLAAALEWAAQHHDQINALERNFLAASVAARDRNVRRRRASLASIGLVLLVGLIVATITALLVVREQHVAQSGKTPLWPKASDL
jgi:hypothetical protein